MLEQEIKVLNIDTEKLITKLLKYGAKRTFSGFITDMKFHHTSKHIDFSVRIRKKNALYYVTFKKKLPNRSLKQCLEIECLLCNPNAFMQKIQEQGFQMKRITKKMRVSYSIKDTVFDIDCYGDIPPFLEIESKQQKLIYFWINELGLGNNKRLICGTSGLFQYYGKEAF